MAIRMKEWSLKAYPPRGVQIPTEGISGMDDAAGALARGVKSLGSSLDELFSAQERVAASGEHAVLSGALQQVIADAGEHLLGGDEVRDWDYAWMRETAAPLEQALAQVDESRRDAARQRAEALMERASLDTRRRYEVNRISRAREQWQTSVDAAAARGDAETATARLESGRDVFVPESEMEARRDALLSRCKAAQWGERLRNAPMEALTDWNAAEAERPSAEADALAVQTEMESARRRLRGDLGDALVQGVREGKAPDAAVIERAQRAGVLTLPPPDSRKTLSLREELELMRALDAREAENADSRADWQLRLALLNAPLSQRRRLLDCWEEGNALPQAERRELSAGLWNLYLAGRFGCAGDAVPQQRMAAMLREGHRRLANDGVDGAQTWLKSLQERRSRWVCFEESL